MDNLQGENKENKQKINDCSSQPEKMQLKMADMEYHSRRSNVRLIYLKEGDETVDQIGFLQRMIPKWIPSISHKVEIERAHRIYSRPGTSNATDRPTTLIFRVLRYNNENADLQGPPVQQAPSHSRRSQSSRAPSPRR